MLTTSVAVLVAGALISFISRQCCGSDPLFEIPHRGCYFPDWAQYRGRLGRFTAQNVDPRLCTYIVVAFGNISNNTIDINEPNDQETFDKLNAYKTWYPNLKILLAVGGRNRKAQLSSMAASPAQRGNFVQSVITKLRGWRIDGLDIDWDWEFIATSDDKVLLDVLLKDLRQGFEHDGETRNVQRLCLTTALHWTQQLLGKNMSALNSYIDLANVVTYDQGSSVWSKTLVRHHSTLFKGPLGLQSPSNMVSILRQWAALGIAKAKLVAGLPLYGRGWILQNSMQHSLGSPASDFITDAADAGVVFFYQICRRVQLENATNTFDSNIGASYAYTDKWWIGYSDQETIKKKTEWALSHGFGGVYVWDVSEDDFHNVCGFGKNPLLGVIRNVSMLYPQRLEPAETPSSLSTRLLSSISPLFLFLTSMALK